MGEKSRQTSPDSPFTCSMPMEGRCFICQDLYNGIELEDSSFVFSLEVR